MHSRILPVALLAITALSGLARSETAPDAFQYTLQVAAFLDSQSTEDYAARLRRLGQRPVWGSINIPERGGVWFRVYVGEFNSAVQAQAEGERLLSLGIIREFLVKEAGEIGLLSRSRRTAPKTSLKESYLSSYQRRSSLSSSKIQKGLNTQERGYSTVPALGAPSNAVKPPVSARIMTSLAPAVDASPIPRPDPVHLAFNIIAGSSDSKFDVRRGGLWLSGDVEEAKTRLQWIVGEKNAMLLSIEADGRLKVDARLLQAAVSAYSFDPSSDTLLLADYISSNEGLLLIIQMAQGLHRYILHLGPKAPTRGPEINVGGSINLDNNFDSRINPYRKDRKKLNQERPPEGFDSMVAINPAARWFNLRANQIVPVGHITFHELAEAYAKVALGLDYLGQGIRPGAHNVAMDREKILYLQRPGSGIVLTSGSNRVLKTDQEIRQLYAETAGASDQR